MLKSTLQLADIGTWVGVDVIDYMKIRSFFTMTEDNKDNIFALEALDILDKFHNLCQRITNNA